MRIVWGADVGSDHYLVVTTLRVKLKSSVRKKTHKILDIEKLRKETMQEQFRLELHNRFSALAELENTKPIEHAEQNVEEEWKTIKDTVVNTAQEVVGFRRGSKKEMWISDGTWTAIDERRNLKARKEHAYIIVL